MQHMIEISQKCTLFDTGTSLKFHIALQIYRKMSNLLNNNLCCEGVVECRDYQISMTRVELYTQK